MSSEMTVDQQLRNTKGRFLPKKNPKKFRLRLTNDEKRLLESLRIEQIEVNSLLGIKSPSSTFTPPMRLLPNVLLRAGSNFESLVFEAVRGEFAIDSTQLKEIITKLTIIHETMEHLAVVKHDLSDDFGLEADELVSDSHTMDEEEEELEVIPQLQTVQHFLYALKFMNRLDEVLLLSLEDPGFLLHTSNADISEVQAIITLLEKSNDLRLISKARSELQRLGSLMIYKSQIPPHYLLLLISSDPNAMLETRQLQGIEDTIHLLADQLVEILQSSISEKKHSHNNYDEEGIV